MNAGQIVGARVVERDIAVVIQEGLAVLVVQHVFVSHLRIFKERRDGVEAETSHTLLEPEGDDVFEGLVDLGIVPVEVGLLNVELVVVVLARLLVPLPGRVAEVGLPVVGRLALVGCRSGPCRRATCTSRGRDWCATSATAGTTCACLRCGSSPCPSGRGCGAYWPRRRGGRSRPWCRTWDRWLRSRRCRSRSRPAARDRWA